MQKTNIRQQTILDILKAGPVYSQDELSQRLQETGIQTTQATLSRDLKALKISKVPGEGYVLPAPHAVQPPAADLPGGSSVSSSPGRWPSSRPSRASPTPSPSSSTTGRSSPSSAPSPGTIRSSPSSAPV